MKRYKDFFYEEEAEEDEDYSRRDGKRNKKSWKENQKNKLMNRYKDQEED